jgi:hypothetical protein
MFLDDEASFLPSRPFTFAGRLRRGREVPLSAICREIAFCQSGRPSSAVWSYCEP